MALDPRLLRSFVVLAEELHFGRAAGRLHIAQSGLSVQLRRLEEQVGSPLFTRSSRKVELTHVGRAMLDPARAAIRAAEQAERAAREAAHESRHLLRVGVDHFIEDVIPTVDCYALEHPELTILLPRMNEALGQAMLNAGQIDAFVGFLPAMENSDLRRLHFMNVPLHATVGPDTPLASSSSVSLAEFRESTIACVSRRVEVRGFDYLTDLLSEGRGPETLTLLEIDATGSASNVEIAIEIAAGRAVGVNTPATVAVHAKQLRSIPFDPPILLPSSITWSADRSPVLDAFTQDLSAFAPSTSRMARFTGAAPTQTLSASGGD